MLTQIPGVKGYIETGRVSQICVEDGYVKVMDGSHKMLARGFHTQEEADAWAEEVAKIVSESNTSKNPRIDKYVPGQQATIVQKDVATKRIRDSNRAVHFEIAMRLMNRLLCRVRYGDCKVYHGGIEIPNQFDADIEMAARELKAADGGWEEWT